MKKTLICLMTLFSLAAMTTSASAGNPLLPAVNDFVSQRVTEFDQIPESRKQELAAVAAYVSKQHEAGKSAKLTFICTHNSRRSHLSQIWAMVAASYYQIGDVETYSGGTEATAFNPRAVATIKRAGMQVKQEGNPANPRYLVSYQTSGDPLTCFSKVYNDPSNPQKEFCAVMTCQSANEACPIVQGSNSRIAVAYEDPKVADNTPEETTRYDERSAQICREMLYLFSLVKK
ncbi:low molecular weight phosphatase family protein [Lacunimicrobium album]